MLTCIRNIHFTLFIAQGKERRKIRNAKSESDTADVCSRKECDRGCLGARAIVVRLMLEHGQQVHENVLRGAKAHHGFSVVAPIVWYLHFWTAGLHRVRR